MWTKDLTTVSKLENDRELLPYKNSVSNLFTASITKSEKSQFRDDRFLSASPYRLFKIRPSLNYCVHDLATRYVYKCQLQPRLQSWNNSLVLARTDICRTTAVGSSQSIFPTYANLTDRCSGSRLYKFGVRRLQLDDWVMFQAILWYTLLYVSCNEIIFGGGSNFMTQQDIANLTPATRRERVSGSKWVLVSESSLVLTIWSCKVCMLVIYRRLTYDLLLQSCL